MFDAVKTTMKREIIIITTGLFLLAGFSACKDDAKAAKPGAASSGNSNSIAVDAYIVQPETLESGITLVGTLLPKEETDIHPEVAGKVVQLSVKEGAWVRQGTLLARIFDGDLRAQLKKLEVQLEIAKKTKERQEELMKIGGISQQDFDLSVLSESTIEADIAILKTDINKTFIRAPFDGKLGFKNISIGAYITPLTVLTTIKQVNELKLDFSVPERYARQATLGKKIHFTTETAPGIHTATIVATETALDQQNRSLSIHARVSNSDNKLRAGGFAQVAFDLAKDKNALMVPTQAIIPEARDKKVIVYKNGIAKFTIVETGIRDSSKVQIVKGLSVGDTVVISGLLTIRPEGKIILSTIQNAKES